MDIETGYATGSAPSFMFIPANLNSGSIPPGIGSALQGPTTRHGREALYITEPTTGMSLYWDRATGVLLELSQSYGGATSSITVSETNLWSGLGFLGLDWWLWIVIIIVIVVVIVAIALMLSKKKPPVAPAPQVQPPQPPPPPPPPTP